jgi:hypothetical protein
MEPDRPHQDNYATFRAERPEPLTAFELKALEEMFGEYLQWPPVFAPQALSIQSTAHQLQISADGVKSVLRKVQTRAAMLGAATQSSITAPDGLYVLAKFGYLRPPQFIVDAQDLILPSGDSAGDVWVVDDRSRYHLISCILIRGRSATAMSWAAASQAGIPPCSLCRPTHD